MNLLFLYIEVDFLEWLTGCVAQLIQQLLPMSGRSKNPVVIQPMRMDVSAGLQDMLESGSRCSYQ